MSIVASVLYPPSSMRAGDLRTISYLANPRVLLIEGIQVNMAEVTVAETTPAPTSAAAAVKVDRVGYDLSLRAYLATPGCNMNIINLKTVQADNQSTKHPLDYYAAAIHASIISLLRDRLNVVHNLKLKKTDPIPEVHHFGAALFILDIVGRKAVKAILNAHLGSAGTAFERNLIAVWSIYQYDKSFPSKPRKTLRTDNFDGLLRISTIVMEGETSDSHIVLNLVDDNWVACLWRTK